MVGSFPFFPCPDDYGKRKQRKGEKYKGGIFLNLVAGLVGAQRSRFLALEWNGRENGRMRIKKSEGERKDGYWVGVGDLFWVAGAQQRPT